MNSDDFKLLMDAVADLVAPVVAENERLTGEIKALTDLLDDMVTPEQFRDITDTQGVLTATVDSLKAGMVTVGDELAALTTRTDDIDKGLGSVNTKLKGLGTDAMSRIGSLDKNIEQVKESIGTLWDENFKHQVAAMIPDWSEESDHIVKRLNAVEEKTTAYGPQIEEWFGKVTKQIEQIEPKQITKDDMFVALDEYWPEAEKHLEPMVKGLIPGEDVVVGQIAERIFKRLPDMVRDAMPEALAPTDLQVIEAVKAVYPSIRHDLLKRLPAMKHRGTYSPEEQYDIGDEVIKSGSTYRLMEASTDGPPSEAWQMIAQRGRTGSGKPGDKGKPGDTVKGKDGVSVKDITMDGTLFVQELTDGNVLTIDMAEFIEEIIKRMGE